MMQPPPLPESFTIHYAVPRDVWLRAWRRRLFLSPRQLRSNIITVIAAVFLVLAVRSSALYVALFLILLLTLSYYHLNKSLAKSIDNNPQYTDPKTVTYGPLQVSATGPNWKAEHPWSVYKGFSEDETYVFLHLSPDWLVSIIPKAAFTPEQLTLFRRYASQRNA